MVDRCYERGTTAIECDCGGFSERVDSTPEEIKEYGCGRPYECCNATFVCKVCKKRHPVSLNAPEME